jgi:hypothetical protein
VTWNVGTLAPGATATVSMPMVITAGTASGRLVTVDAETKTDTTAQATHTATALVGTGTFSDSDGDGVSNQFDNCLNHSNPDQRDTNGDGFGNRCDADFDGNLFVNFADQNTFKSRFGTSDLHADFDGNGFVNFADQNIFKSLFGKAPGPSGLAP